MGKSWSLNKRILKAHEKSKGELGINKHQVPIFSNQKLPADTTFMQF
jgi:hypothetical protein